MDKDYRERYKRIGESEWFKKHYEGKSLGDVSDIEEVENLLNRMTEMMVEIAGVPKGMMEISETPVASMTRDVISDYARGWFKDLEHDK